MPKTEVEIINEFLNKNKGKSDTEITDILREKYKETFGKKKRERVRKTINAQRKELGLPVPAKNAVYEVEGKTEYEILRDAVKKKIKSATTIIELANTFNKPPKEIEKVILDLKENGKYNIDISEGIVELSDQLMTGAHHEINLSKFENKIYKFGITADNHLCSKYERLDILNALYDTYEQEGITEVFNAGNWLDGEARFNKYDVWKVGVDPQVEYFLQNYPQRNGIVTKYIAGDDHEGWWVQREKLNIGEYVQMKAEKMGRNDLKYLGYLESDVELKQKEGSAIMKVMHGGGGSAYAVSYTPQKMVESFSAGEKPHILILGHYHKADYFCYRDVHILQAGCTQSQTIFMRKKKIQASLGGWIIEIQQSKDGAINRFKPEWLSFFDKDYYKNHGYYR